MQSVETSNKTKVSAQHGLSYDFNRQAAIIVVSNMAVISTLAGVAHAACSPVGVGDDVMLHFSDGVPNLLVKLKGPLLHFSFWREQKSRKQKGQSVSVFVILCYWKV